MAANRDRLDRMQMLRDFGDEPRVWGFYNTVATLLEQIVLSAKAA